MTTKLSQSVWCAFCHTPVYRLYLVALPTPEAERRRIPLCQECVKAVFAQGGKARRASPARHGGKP